MVCAIVTCSRAGSGPGCDGSVRYALAQWKSGRGPLSGSGRSAAGGERPRVQLGEAARVGEDVEADDPLVRAEVEGHQRDDTASARRHAGRVTGRGGSGIVRVGMTVTVQGRAEGPRPVAPAWPVRWIATPRAVLRYSGRPAPRRRRRMITVAASASAPSRMAAAPSAPGATGTAVLPVEASASSTVAPGAATISVAR